MSKSYSSLLQSTKHNCQILRYFAPESQLTKQNHSGANWNINATPGFCVPTRWRSTVYWLCFVWPLKLLLSIYSVLGILVGIKMKHRAPFQESISIKIENSIIHSFALSISLCVCFGKTHLFSHLHDTPIQHAFHFALNYRGRTYNRREIETHTARDV